MAEPLLIPVPTDRIAEFSGRHGVVRLTLFGSVLRDDFGPASDVDVPMEFRPGRTPGAGLLSDAG
jgi:hypothetical protein